MTVSVGIDIAARSFDLVCRDNGRNQPAQTFAQTPADQAQVVQQLQALRPTHIVVEATGIYYLDLAVALAEAGLPVSVINPKSFRHFAQLKLTGSKTDPVDAALLAEYGARMTPPVWTPPEAIHLALRDIGRQINRLTGARTQAKNRLHALTAKQMTPQLLIDDEQQAIDALDQRLDRLQQAARELIDDCPVLAQQFQVMTAAKGIGQASAIALLAELAVLPDHLKAAQVSRHAGLDVRLNQSGSSVHKPGRLAKTGNAYLRAALFMPALSAVRHDPRARAFYESLIQRGKKKIQALCAVMRKYLTGLWACLRDNTPFDSAKLFSECHLKT
ncbi:transposase [Methylohalomonas lacus]|uniref:Transposase n=1 Tax=Methylohalomonas lacus TaxID=398773 RepID=A0AAE3HLW9_9GAMM|nr:IS110 family transposase [Methylohalomonas lacus]MCS3903554.1 transposase [Methylohalomonas lacus]